MKRLSKIGLLFALLLVADIVSKALVVRYVDVVPWSNPFYPYGGVGVFENLLGVDLSINYVMNRGSAWGLFSEWYIALLCVRILAIGALILYLLKFNEEQSRDLPLTLIVTGALGNVIDCLVYGHVVDMLHFNAWGWNCPVFNIADSAIFFGVMIMLVQSMLKKRRHARA